MMYPCHLLNNVGLDAECRYKTYIPYIVGKNPSIFLKRDFHTTYPVDGNSSMTFT